MKRIIIVDDDETQDVHDQETGQFVEWDTLVGSRIHHIERDDSGRLVLCIEDDEDEGDD